MHKKINPILIVVTVLMLVVGAAVTRPALAQEGTTDPNTPVSNIGGLLPMPEAASVSAVAPTRGTGRLAPTSEQAINPEYLNAAAMESAIPESVIGADGRIRINPTTSYPSRAIAWLYVTWADNSAGTCTGWFIGVRTVVTAGHCVFNTTAGPAYGWAASITVYPGRNAALSPYGSTTAHRLFSVSGWTGSTGNPTYDYGAIQTNIAKGSTTGTFGFRWQSSNSFPGTFTVRGYPGDKPSGTMWTMSGLITAVATSRMWYSMDTFGGQSGSPLYQVYNSVCCYGVGVHTYGTSVSPYFGNSATRIRQAVFNNFIYWRGIAYP